MKMNWLIYGVAFNLVPTLLSVLFYRLLGFKVNMMDYSPDLILVAISIGGGVIYGIKNDYENQEKLKTESHSQAEFKYRGTLNIINTVVGFFLLCLAIGYGLLEGVITWLNSKIFENYNAATTDGKCDDLLEVLEDYTAVCTNTHGKVIFTVALLFCSAFAITGLCIEIMKDKREQQSR